MSRWSDVMVPSYGEPTLTLVRGDGATVWDDAGNSYLDFTSGIAVSAFWGALIISIVGGTLPHHHQPGGLIMPRLNFGAFLAPHHPIGDLAFAPR